MSQKRVVGKLYMYTGHSRWFRLQALAKAADVEFEHVDFGLRKAMTDPEYLAKFPLGMLPALEAADGKTNITECSAISDYVATITNDKSGLMGQNASEAAQIRNWLFICESEFIAPLTLINRAHVGLYPWNQSVIDGMFEALHRRMANIDKWLGDRTYLVGNQYTLADLTLTSVLGHGYAKFFDGPWQTKYPQAFGWWKKMREHERVKGAFGDLEIMETTPPPKQI